MSPSYASLKLLQKPILTYLLSRFPWLSVMVHGVPDRVNIVNLWQIWGLTTFGFAFSAGYLSHGLVAGTPIYLLGFGLCWLIPAVIIFLLTLIDGLGRDLPLLGNPALDQIKDAFTLNGQLGPVDKALLIKWQSQSLYLHRYHWRALLVLNYFSRLEALTSNLKRKQLALAQLTGAQAIFEHHQLQKSIPRGSANLNPSVRKARL